MRPSVAQIMSWASDRTTTREEDRAYSLLGLLDVQMPMLYGEGKNAFRRLQLEILRKSNDQTIFAWGWLRTTGLSDSFLAEDPSWFRDCSDIVSLTPEGFMKALEKDIPEDKLGKIPAKRFRKFTVSNDGIQIWLPTATFGPISEVKLACSQIANRWKDDTDPRDRSLITINVALFPFNRIRFFGRFPKPATRTVEFKQHFLPYESAKCESSLIFKLDCQALSHDGFSLHRVQPERLEAKDGRIILSKTNDFALITYEHDKDNTRFSVLLVYFCDLYYTSVILCPSALDEDKLAFLRLRALGRHFDESWENIKHAHLPRSIQGVRVVPKRSYGEQAECTVTIDVARCSGCCSPLENTSYHVASTPEVSGLMWDYSIGSCCAYCDFLFDSHSARLLLAKSEMKLGDYGRFSYNGEEFEQQGNIFDLAEKLGIDVPIVPMKSGIRHKDKRPVGMGPLIARPQRDDNCRHPYLSLALYDAVGWSLSVTQQFVSFLNTLSFRLSDATLVTTIIQCSECYYDTQDSFPTESKDDAQDPKTWRKFDTNTPLCELMTPMSWRQVSFSTELLETLRNIQRYFSVLVGWEDKLDEPMDSSESVDPKATAEFWTDIFGGGNFKNFIGEMAFFDELPSIFKAEVSDESHLETDSDIGALSKASKTEREQRIEGLVTFLTQIDDPELDSDPEHFAFDRTELWGKAIELMSAPFATEFLQAIAATYQGWKLGSRRRGVEFDRHEILCKVEEIKLLYEVLAGADDENERRTLREDVTGKILLTCWGGIAIEIKQIVEEVADRFVNDEAVDQDVQMARAHRISNIGKIFMEAVGYVPDDGLDSLRRMMHDAADGVSKYQLLLAERAERVAQNIESTGHS